MQNKRPRLVLLCVELQAVRALTSMLGRVCELNWARDAKGLVNLAGDEPAPIAIIVDQSMPNVNAIEVLGSVKNVRPQTRRILLTEYCDLGIIVQGLHTGAVQQIVYKPVHAPELLASLGVNVSPAMMSQGAPQQQTRAAG